MEVIGISVPMEMHRLLHAFRYGQMLPGEFGEAGSGSLSLTVSLKPSRWFARLAPVSHVGGICPSEFVQTFGPQQMILGTA